MIRDHTEFEAALSEGVQLLDDAPPEGTSGHARLLVLMKEIAAYRPTVQADVQKDVSEAVRLSQRLDAFQARLPPHYSTHWHSMIGGDLSAPRP